MAISLTDRDREMLSTMTHHVRALTLEQIARTWWENSCSGQGAALSRLSRLEKANLVQTQLVMAHSELPLSAPVCTWAPGDTQPPFGAIAYRLQRRWTDGVRRTRIFVATVKAAHQFGGFGGRLKRPLQATHDLHVSAIFLFCRERFMASAPGWLLEDAIIHERRGDKLPDAVVRHGASDLVIEFGGAYREDRVARVHEDCAQRGLPYELW